MKDLARHAGNATLFCAFIVLAIAGLGYEPLYLWGAWACLLAYFRIYERDNPGPFWLLLVIGGAVAGFWMLSFLPGSTFEQWRLAR